VDLITFRDFCISLPETTEGFPFGPEVIVFKVCNKIFALCDVDEFKSINLKCDPLIAIELREEYPGIVNPGFHMNKQHWNTIEMNAGLPIPLVKQWTRDSYDLIVAKLPEKERELIQNLLL